MRVPNGANSMQFHSREEHEAALHKETAFTKDNLDKLWNAIEYARATIPTFPEKSTDKPGWVYIHGGRAHQSRAFLNKAIQIINQMKEELE